MYRRARLDYPSEPGLTRSMRRTGIGRRDKWMITASAATDRASAAAATTVIRCHLPGSQCTSLTCDEAGATAE